jgi:hypothetical protein
MPPLREPNGGRVSEPHQPDSRSARRSFKGLRRKQAGFRFPRFGRAALQNVTRSVTISGTTGLQRDGEVSKCLKNWRAGTGLNRRHQDFQCSPWAPADILMGPRLKQSAPLARTPVSRRRAWGRVPPNHSEAVRRQWRPRAADRGASEGGSWALVASLRDIRPAHHGRGEARLPSARARMVAASRVRAAPRRRAGLVPDQPRPT